MTLLSWAKSLSKSRGFADSDASWVPPEIMGLLLWSSGDWKYVRERNNSFEMFVYLYICIGMLLFLCRDNAVAAKSFGKFESNVIAKKCSYIRN